MIHWNLTARHDLNYVKLDGNIGLVVNGAGFNGDNGYNQILWKAANFMDVAGAATPENYGSI